MSMGLNIRKRKWSAEVQPEDKLQELHESEETNDSPKAEDNMSAVQTQQIIESIPRTSAASATVPRQTSNDRSRSRLILNQSKIDKLSQTMVKALRTRPLPSEIRCKPDNLKINLLPHQGHALAWMLWRESQYPRGGILSDDMGLGKTVSIIALILATKCKRHKHSLVESDGKSKGRFRSLILCSINI